MKYQQGDVILRPTNDVPKDATIKKDGVLAEGEATGHAHTLEDPSTATLYETKDKDLYLAVTGDSATIRHQEHGPITLPGGVYKIGKVREVDPFTEEIHSVQD
jgi:hypothetical protein